MMGCMAAQVVVAALTLAGLLILHGFLINGIMCWAYVYMGIRCGVSPTKEDIQNAMDYAKRRPKHFLMAMFGL